MFIEYINYSKSMIFLIKIIFKYNINGKITYSTFEAPNSERHQRIREIEYVLLQEISVLQIWYEIL
jgi:hypothetical protein